LPAINVNGSISYFTGANQGKSEMVTTIFVSNVEESGEVNCRPRPLHKAAVLWQHL